MTTCKSCGYDKQHCECGKARNTSGDVRMYQNYNDYTNPNHNEYAITSKIGRTSVEERKIMEELAPIDGELLTSYLKRTTLAEDKLTEYSYTHHLYGTRKTWTCHTSSRYCFICTMCNFINITRSIFQLLPEHVDISRLIIKVNQMPDGQHTFTLEERTKLY